MFSKDSRGTVFKFQKTDPTAGKAHCRAGRHRSPSQAPWSGLQWPRRPRTRRNVPVSFKVSTTRTDRASLPMPAGAVLQTLTSGGQGVALVQTNGEHTIMEHGRLELCVWYAACLLIRTGGVGGDREPEPTAISQQADKVLVGCAGFPQLPSLRSSGRPVRSVE